MRIRKILTLSMCLMAVQLVVGQTSDDAPGDAEECDCLELDVCMFVMKGQPKIALKKAQLAASVSRASDIFHDCCIAFKLATGKVHTLDYKDIPIGKNGKSVHDILDNKKRLRINRTLQNKRIIVDRKNNQIEDFELGDVLDAMKKKGQEVCPDGKQDGKACRNIRIFGFPKFGGSAGTVGFGTIGGYDTLVDLSNPALGSTVAHEIGHNLRLDHPADGSDEKKDKNNLMQPSDADAPGATTIDPYVNKQALTPAQCKIAETRIKDANPQYCHTVHKEQQCPETFWEELRDDCSDLKKKRDDAIEAIKARYAPLIAAKEALIPPIKKQIKDIEDDLKKNGYLTEEEIREIQENIRKNRKEFNKLRDQSITDLEEYRKKPDRRSPLRPLGECVAAKQRRNKVPFKNRFPKKKAPNNLVKTCFEEIVSKQRNNYYKKAKDLLEEIKEDEEKLADHEKAKNRNKKKIQKIKDLQKQIRDIEREIGDLERKRAREIIKERGKYGKAVEDCTKKYEEKNHGIYNTQLDTL
eukprot:TRINITY_DN18683_c0_g1_i1.p1 TRINITY_DN18683_c0_g1~~TRINITY_DN18683_c0_g1_i1.p1  ORF type:complete len:525 (+),score=129.72 TRINITY_DN18683_c0_g1_i1:49-1623(+)